MPSILVAILDFWEAQNDHINSFCGILISIFICYPPSYCLIFCYCPCHEWLLLHLAAFVVFSLPIDYLYSLFVILSNITPYCRCNCRIISYFQLDITPWKYFAFTTTSCTQHIHSPMVLFLSRHSLLNINIYLMSVKTIILKCLLICHLNFFS